MAGFAAAKPLAHPVGETFNYSSGTSLILSRLWQDAAGAEALSYPEEGAVRSDRHDQRRARARCARHLRRLVLPLCDGARLGAVRPVHAAGWRLERQGNPAGRLRRLDARGSAGSKGHTARARSGFTGRKATRRPGRTRMSASTCPTIPTGSKAMTGNRSPSSRRRTGRGADGADAVQTRLQAAGPGVGAGEGAGVAWTFTQRAGLRAPRHAPHSRGRAAANSRLMPADSGLALQFARGDRRAARRGILQARPAACRGTSAAGCSCRPKSTMCSEPPGASDCSAARSRSPSRGSSKAHRK